MQEEPAIHQSDSVYLAGNFNSWQPANSNFLFLKDSHHRLLEIKNVPAGKYAYKLTKGSWEKVECSSAGKDIGNRILELSSDTTLLISVAAWMDDFITSRKHTASANVQIIDTAFSMPQLGRNRRIWIYLPQNYAQNNKRYPVMYMQDGQNLFDEFTAAYGEWGVDESMDSLIKKGRPGCIVVGIDNGGEARMNEYNPYLFTWKDSTGEQTFLPQGNEYVDFLKQTLKPYIDKHFRTMDNKENTIIAGSSVGALIAYYAMLKYPAVFGKAGIFSPAFCIATPIITATDSLAGKLSGKLFFYIGEQEGKRYVDDMIEIEKKIGKNSTSMIYSIINSESLHNEQAWKKSFIDFYNFIMADGFNVITNTAY